MEKYINLKNKRFGRLTVIKKLEKPQGVKSAYAYWLCKCECGNEIVASSSSLRRGHTRSCGCLAKDLLTSHGQSKTGLYRRWYGMRQRCNNPKDISYPNYGGRGIRVCEEWDTDFQSFYTWAIANGFSSELQLDRIDTNGNYEPVPFPVSWTVKMKKKQKETQDILSYHSQAAGCSDKARAKASGGRQPIEECGRTGL